MNKVINKETKIDIKNIVLKIITIAFIGILTQIVASYILTLVLDNFFPKTAEAYSSSVSSLIEITPYKLFRVCVMFPIIEELVFRLLLLGTLKKVLPFMAANVIQAVVFGIYHGNIVQGIYAFLLGLFIGYLYFTFGGVGYTIVFHMFINFAGMFLDRVMGGISSKAIQAVIAIVSLAIIVGLVYSAHKINKKDIA